MSTTAHRSHSFSCPSSPYSSTHALIPLPAPSFTIAHGVSDPDAAPSLEQRHACLPQAPPFTRPRLQRVVPHARALGYSQPVSREALLRHGPVLELTRLNPQQVTVGTVIDFCALLDGQLCSASIQLVALYHEQGRCLVYVARTPRNFQVLVRVPRPLLQDGLVTQWIARARRFL